MGQRRGANLFGLAAAARAIVLVTIAIVIVVSDAAVIGAPAAALGAGARSADPSREVAAGDALVAERYEALVAPLNTRFSNLAERLSAGPDPDETRAISREYAAIEQAFARGLARLALPDAARGRAQAAIGAAEKVASLHTRLAEAADSREVLTLATELSPALDAQIAAVAELRAALGLATAIDD